MRRSRAGLACAHTPVIPKVAWMRSAATAVVSLPKAPDGERGCDDPVPPFTKPGQSALKDRSGGRSFCFLGVWWPEEAPVWGAPDSWLGESADHASTDGEGVAHAIGLGAGDDTGGFTGLVLTRVGVGEALRRPTGRREGEGHVEGGGVRESSHPHGAATGRTSNHSPRRRHHPGACARRVLRGNLLTALSVPTSVSANSQAATQSRSHLSTQLDWRDIQTQRKPTTS